jgi:large subunit ribosomal protein L31
MVRALLMARQARPGRSRKLTLHAGVGREGRRYTQRTMKSGIHPEYVEAHVRCTCGNEFTTRSTKPELHVEICSNCHPFYTGRQKLVDTGGRVERFQRRAAKSRR